MTEDIYFDNGATTRVSKEVADVMYDILTNEYGNPSSLHRKGLMAEHILKNSRTVIANEMRVSPDEIYFTASGSEANNLAILGFMRTMRNKGEIITSKIEHKCVLECMKKLEEDGFSVHYLDVDENGIVDLSQLESLVNDKTQLVSIMHVNNECGSIEPIEKIYSIIKSKNMNTVFHTDDIQGFCKIDIKEKCYDMRSVSAHKIHGPKGVGALYVKKGIRLSPVILGGGQEKGLRGGTENVSGIAGFAEAARTLNRNYDNVLKIKKHIIKRVTNEIPKVYVNGDFDKTSPYILNICMLGLRSEIILHSLEQMGIYVSSGSACSSNKPSPSHVLLAMGFDLKRVDSSIRLSFNNGNTLQEADAFCDALLKISNVNKKVRRI